MLNTKQNLRNRKITEALEETITGTDPMLFLEVIANIRDTSSNIIYTINMQSFTDEEIKTLYELAEICSFTIDKIFSLVVGIE